MKFCNIWLETKELVGITKGKPTVKDVYGNLFKVDVDDPKIATTLTNIIRWHSNCSEQNKI